MSKNQGGRSLTVVLDMQDRRPVWAMPGWVPERLRAALPPGSELRVMETPNDGSGDGSGRVAPEVLVAVRGAQVYLGYGIGAELLRSAPDLEWVHSGSAGVGSALTEAMLSSPVRFTNSAGIHAEPMAETVVAMLLYFFRGMDLAATTQERERDRWDRTPFFQADSPMRELNKSRVGVLGFGGVGSAVARKCAALGAEVWALRRGGPGERARGGPAGPGVAVFHGEAAFHRILEECDAVVLCLPETDETTGLMDRSALALLRPGAVLVNVGRGGLIDTAALVDTLAEGRIRGVGVDVFDPEPIPDDHPFWSFPNVLVTPHVSAVTRGFWERETKLIEDNIRRFSVGAPLINAVEKALGY